MGGYRVKFLESFNTDYICPDCSLLLRDPVQIVDCGHRLCQPCIEEQKGDVIICSKCGEKVTRKNLKLDRGFKNDMRTLSITCSFCDWTGILKNYQDHLDNTHPNPQCIYCEQYLPTVNELNRHQQYVCEKIPINCPFKQFGCEEILSQTNLNEHYRSRQHQNVLMNIVLQMRSLTTNTDSRRKREDNIVQFDEADQTINIVSNSVEALKEDEQRLNSEVIIHQQTLDSLTKKSAKSKISIQEQNAFIDELRRNQDVALQELETMKQKLNDNMKSSCDGTFLWKITGVQEKRG